MESPQKINNRTTYDLAILLPGIYLKGMKTLTLKDLCTLMLKCYLQEPRHGNNLSVD